MEEKNKLVFHDLENNVEQSINWEQRRWEAALAIISGLNANRMFHRHSHQEIASMAVRQADDLIEAYTKRPNEWTNNNS